MAALTVRNVEDELVRVLKRRAVEEGVSAEELHRRILRRALTGRGAPGPSLWPPCAGWASWGWRSSPTGAREPPRVEL